MFYYNEINPLWILCQPRSGSSYLCDLLNNIQIFSPFEDKRIKKNCKNLAFSEWLRIYISQEEFEKNPPKNLKCLYEQFWSLFGEDTTCDYICNLIPDIKFVWLKRKNIIEQTASLYFALKTKKYHIRNQEKLLEYQSEHIEFNAELALKIYQSIIDEQSIWQSFLKDKEFKTVYYEDIVLNPKKEIQSILNYINVSLPNISIKTSLMKLERPDKKIFCEKLKEII